VRAKALSHLSVKWPWIETELAARHGPDVHALRLSYGRPGQPRPQVDLQVALDDVAALTGGRVEAVRAFRADVAVLSTCAVSTREGLTVMESDDAMVKRAITASSTRRVLPTAPSKSTQTNTYRFGRIEDLDALLTTSQIDPGTLEELRGAGVDVVLCD